MNVMHPSRDFTPDKPKREFTPDEMETHFGPAAEQQEVPANIIAEQALLGAMLVNNDTLSAIKVQITAKHFYEPLHREIFEAIETLIKAGRTANPVTVKPLVEDGMVGEMTVGRYIARLAGEAVSIVHADDYARGVVDAAGKRACITLGEKLVQVGYANELSIIDEYEALRAKFDEVSAALRSEEKTRTLADAAKRALASTADAYAGRGLTGIDYGFAPLMNLIGPLLPTHLIIIGGATKQGKSTLIEQIVAGAAINGHPVWINSGEMQDTELAQRALARLTDIKAWQMARGKVSENDFERLEIARRNAETWQERVFICDDSLTLRQIEREMTAFAKHHPNGMAVVDHIGLVERDSSNVRMGDAEFAPVVTRALKMNARECKIPVIAAAQLKKNTFEVTDRKIDRRTFMSAISRRPKYSDIFGSVEKDANHVIIPFRAEPILQELEPSEHHEHHGDWESVMEGVKDKAELVLALSRHTRWPQRKEVGWDGGKTMFRDLSETAQTRMF